MINITFPDKSVRQYEAGVTPTKNYDETYHYEFSNWKGYEGEGRDITITGINRDMEIYPDFDAIKVFYFFCFFTIINTTLQLYP